MTKLGILTLFLCLIPLLSPWRWVIATLFFTTSWATSAFYEAGGNIIRPFYPVLFAVAIRMLYSRKAAPGISGPRLPTGMIAGVIAYAVVSSFVCPLIFEGAETILPRDMIDEVFTDNTRSRLTLQISNFAQASYWLLHGVFLAWLLKSNVRIDDRDWIRGITVGATAFIAISLAEIACDILNAPFPYEFFVNWGDRFVGLQGVNGMTRLQSTLIEPSILAATMTPVCCFLSMRFIYERKSTMGVLALLSGIVLLRSLSTTAFLGLFFIFAICALSILYSFRSLSTQRLSPWLLLSGGLTVLVTIVVAFQLGLFELLLIEKMDSQSADSRTGADGVALEILMNSFGLGYGFGSFRASSLLTTLLGCGGLVAFGAAFLLLYHLGSRFLRPRGDYLVWLIAGTTLSELLVCFIAIPDPHSVVIWMFLFLYFYLIHHSARRMGPAPAAGGLTGGGLPAALRVPLASSHGRNPV